MSDGKSEARKPVLCTDVEELYEKYRTQYILSNTVPIARGSDLDWMCRLCAANTAELNRSILALWDKTTKEVYADLKRDAK